MPNQGLARAVPWLVADTEPSDLRLPLLTIIGIPLGIAGFKMAGAALVPFGKETVRKSDLTTSTDAIAV